MQNSRKIALIGPVYPYKGGISHHTGLLYHTLQTDFNVQVFSYKMQYPRFLYKQEQKDYRNNTLKIPHTDFCIHTINPFNWFSTVRRIKKWNPDLVIIQWWHPYFSPCYWSICKGLRNCQILFVCHNVFPHERFPMDRFLTKKVLSRGNFFIVHSKQDEENLKKIKKEVICYRTVLPSFYHFKKRHFTQTEGRQYLHLKNTIPILLFFGFVREYKGLKYLLRAMPTVIQKYRDLKLIIAGDFAGNKNEYVTIINDLNIAENITIYDAYIADEKVELFFAASDLVILPYQSATQSGIIQIAYEFEKPVIATKVGGLPEVVSHGKTGYIVEPKNSTALSGAILRFLEERETVDFQGNIRKEAEKYSWEQIKNIIKQITMQEAIP